MRTKLLFSAIVASVATLPAQAELRGRHFEVHSWLGAGAADHQLLRSLDAVVAPATEVFGRPLPALEAPLVLCLYSSSEQYARAEAALTGGLFQRNLAFAHWPSRSAHVALQPPFDIAARKQLGLPLQTRRLAVHEAAHLVRYALFDNARAHPRWLADGFATHAEIAVLGIKQPEAEPAFATMIDLAQRLLAKPGATTVAKVLHGTADELSFYEAYAVHWMLFRWLHTTHRTALDHALGDLPALRARTDLPKRLAKRLLRALAQAGVNDVDADFSAWLTAQHPQWSEATRSLERRDDGWLQTSFASAPATAWHLDTSDQSTGLTLRTAVEFVASNVGTAYILLGTGETTNDVVIELPSSGGAMVYVRSETGPGPRLGALPLAPRSQLQIHANDTGLLLRGPQGPALQLAIAGLDGRFGLSVSASAAVHWIGLQTTPSASAAPR